MRVFIRVSQPLSNSIHKAASYIQVLVAVFSISRTYGLVGYLLSCADTCWCLYRFPCAGTTHHVAYSPGYNVYFTITSDHIRLSAPDDQGGGTHLGPAMLQSSWA